MATARCILRGVILLILPVAFAIAGSAAPPEGAPNQAVPAQGTGDTIHIPTIVLPNDQQLPKDTIGYGATRDSINAALGDVPSLRQICSLSVLAIGEIAVAKRDANLDMYAIRPDTAFGTPCETAAFAMIQAYAKLLSFGVCLPGRMPNLIRTRKITDPTPLRVLPKQPGKGALGDGRFFFLGAGPFATKCQSEDGAAFRDPRGRAETRYACEASENTEFLLRAVRRFLHVRIDVSYGSPLASYDSGPQSVRGVGSLVHVLRDRIPAYFITKQGIVNTALISVTNKLIPEDLCVTNCPKIEFACAEPPKSEVLGIYVPYDRTDLSRCAVKRKGPLWIADINGDGIPDLAGVSCTIKGNANDSLVRIIWYVNVEGTWKVIDQAEELDCT